MNTRPCSVVAKGRRDLSQKFKLVWICGASRRDQSWSLWLAFQAKLASSHDATCPRNLLQRLVAETNPLVCTDLNSARVACSRNQSCNRDCFRYSYKQAQYMRNEVMVNWCILQVRFTSFHRHSTGLTKLYQHVDALGLLQWFHHGLQWRNHGNCQTPTRNSINSNKHNNDHEHETHFKVIQNQVVKSNQHWNLWNRFWMLHIFINISWHYKRMQCHIQKHFFHEHVFKISNCSVWNRLF